MNLPKVSIIIPVFNAERFLAETMNSAVNQKWPNKEIIVVDDGSTDSSFEIARAFKSENIKVCRKKNLGAAGARNYGLARATGEYIQYLDADDLLSSNKIEQQVKALRVLPDGYIASCRWGKFLESSKNAVFENQKVFGDFSPVDWLVTAWEGGGMMQTACWLVPKGVAVVAGPWNERLSLHDDGEYFARILLASRGVRFCKGATVYYRTNLHNSLSRQRNRKAAESAFHVYESYRENILKIEDSARVRHALMMNYLSFIYRFHPRYPTFIFEAQKRIRCLGFEKLPPYGGKKFRLLVRFLGFYNALKLRALLKYS